MFLYHHLTIIIGVNHNYNYNINIILYLHYIIFTLYNMILLIRGHIRLSFSNYNLLNLVKKIYSEDKDLVIYISTFNIIQNSTSWRKMNTINTAVTEEMIKNYFKEL